MSSSPGGNETLKEGTAIIVVGHENENWLDDENRYRFRPHSVANVELTVRKPKPRYLWITASGIRSDPFTIEVEVPQEVGSGGKIFLVVQWSENSTLIQINAHSTSSAVVPLDNEYKPPHQLGEAVRREEVYLKKVEEMQIRAELSTHYDLITAAAILRHLLIDGDRLVDLLTRSRQSYRPMFEVMQPKATDVYETEPVVVWTQIDTENLPRTDPLRAKVKLKHFLAMRCLRFRGKEYTVHDVISSCANVRGGVHFAKPDEIQQSLIDLDELACIGGVEMSISCIGGIVRVARRALEPLTQAIRVELKHSSGKTRGDGSL